jgi:hypothetical protein
MSEIKNPGEDRAWELLAAMQPDDVCRDASVSYDSATRHYTIHSFGMDFRVSAANRTISSSAPGSEVLLQKLGYFFRLSILWYLVHARDVACTGRLVKLEGIKGGDIFTRGSHVLPLEPLARKYGRNREGFIEKGNSLGAEFEKLGDAALRLSPLPRIPVVLILWIEDEEFPARADLLFDSTCEMQMPTDIIWSVAMMSVLVMM